jgi:allantoinase
VHQVAAVAWQTGNTGGWQSPLQALGSPHERPRGGRALEPDIVPYSPILHRPRLTWPGGARVALWICPNIEHYELHPAFVRTREPWPRSPAPDVLCYSLRDYGNRVGLWRLFEVMDDLGLPATVSLSMAVIQHYPAILEAMEKRRWELMSHGLYNTRYHWDFTEDEERAAMLECRDIHRRLTGREQRGWFSPAITNTLRTFDLAAETGYDYCCDLYHDDQPFPVRTRTGNLITVPYTVDLNDMMVWRRGQEIDSFARQISDYFDTVYAEGAEQGRVMCIALHPFWVGQPHRIRGFRQVLERILSHPGVWATTAAAIADHYRAQALPAVEAHLAARAALYG